MNAGTEAVQEFIAEQAEPTPFTGRNESSNVTSLHPLETGPESLAQTGGERSAELLAAALDYAARGWPVFPLHTPAAGGCTCHDPACSSIGKHPRTQRGCKDATTDANKIREWWKAWPEANIGIATGEESRLIVLDVDSYNGGGESIPESIPETVTAMTGGGGYHYLFKRPDVPKYKTRSGFLHGLDSRADGGYIVAPPSLHKSGKRYEWEASGEPGMVPLADPPAWFANHIRAGESPSIPQMPFTQSGRVVEFGRHDDANKVMAHLARLGISRENALHLALAEGARGRWTRDVPLDELARGFDGAVDKLARGEWKAPAESPDPSRHPTFRLLASAELAQVPDTEWRIHDVLPAQGVGLILGQSQAGKSFVAIDLAARVALGLPWFGHTTKACKTAYVALEGRAGIKHRVRAWEIHHNSGIYLPDDFAVSLDSLRLTAPVDVEELARAFADAGGHGGLIIIDTLAQAIAGTEENSGGEMGLVVEAMQRLQGMIGGLVLAVHHMGKDPSRGARGWSGLYAACDSAISVSASGSTRTVSTDPAKGGKAKDAPATTHECALVGAPAGVGKDGEPVFSAVLADAQAAPRASKLTRGEQRAIQTYRQACLDGLGIVDDSCAFVGLHRDTWRDVYYAHSTADTQDAKQKAFARDRERLVVNGLATVRDDVYRVTTAAMQSLEPKFMEASQAGQPT